MPTPILIVLDTNVLVSGLLKRNSPPEKVLDMILAGKVRVAMDERVYDEYTRALARPRLRIPPNQAPTSWHSGAVTRRIYRPGDLFVM